MNAQPSCELQRCCILANGSQDLSLLGNVTPCDSHTTWGSGHFQVALKARCAEAKGRAMLSHRSQSQCFFGAPWLRRGRQSSRAALPRPSCSRSEAKARAAPSDVTAAKTSARSSCEPQGWLHWMWRTHTPEASRLHTATGNPPTERPRGPPTPSFAQSGGFLRQQLGQASRSDLRSSARRLSCRNCVKSRA